MKTTPQIRFREYTEDWEQRKYSEIIDLLSGQDFNPNEYNEDGIGIPYLTGASCIENGHTIAIRWTECPRCIAKQGDTVLVCKGSGCGTIATVNQEKAHIARQFMALKVKMNRLDNKFNYYLLTSVMKNIKTDARGLIAGIARDAVLTQEVKIPSLEEQEEIADYFQNLDRLITLHQRKCEEIKKLKKFMLQKMFPQNGTNVPEVRFDNFTDAWEQRKFGDLADYKKGPFGSAITKDMFVPKDKDSVKVYEQQNAINKDWSLERYFLPKEYVLTKLKSFEVYGGDIIVSCAGTIGEIYEIPQNAEAGVINQALMRVRVNEDIVDKNMFIIAFSNMIDEFTRTHSNGSAIKNIPPFADLKPMQVLIPSMSEQKKISGYFCHLDRLITLHQRKCDELRQVKRFMLENMFV